MWESNKPKPMTKPKPKQVIMVRGRRYVKPIKYTPPVRRTTKRLVPKAFTRAVSKAGSGFIRSAAGRLKETDTFQKYKMKRSKDKIWKQYKKDKQLEVRTAELEAYKKKLYGK